MTPRATRPATVACGYLQALFDHLRQQGVDARVLLPDARAAIDGSVARVPEAQAAAWFDRAARALDDATLGLRVGQHIRPGHYGPLGYVAMACATLGQAMARQQHYQELVLSIAPPCVHDDGHHVELVWTPGTGDDHMQLADFNLAALVTTMRWITDQPLPLSAVAMTYPAPPDAAVHAQVFGVAPRFSAAAYRIAFPRAWLELPLAQADATLHDLMDRLACTALRGLSHDGAVDARARDAIAQRLGHAGVTLDAIAATLHMAPRSLQRHLRQAGTNLAALVDEVRAERARTLLADPRLDLVDIAYLLGFSEHSAFARAFRRWTGLTPQGWRRTQAGGQGRSGSRS